MDGLEEINREILECARYGEDEDLRALLNSGGDVNYADSGGNTALHRAGHSFLPYVYFVSIEQQRQMANLPACKF